MGMVLVLQIFKYIGFKYWGDIWMGEGFSNSRYDFLPKWPLPPGACKK